MFTNHLIDLPDHPLLGTIVRVEAIVFTNHPERERVDPYSLSGSVRLTYADGRVMVIYPEGAETEGLTIQVVQP